MIHELIDDYDEEPDHESDRIPKTRTTAMIRCRLPELMDQPLLDDAQRRRALRSLNRLNRVLGVDRDLCRALQHHVDHAASPVLDLGAGGGGFLGYLAGRNGNPGRRLLGVDRSAATLNVARSWQDPAIRWIVGDGLRLPLADGSVDVVTSSLFLHHFDETQVVEILSESARVARRGVVMGDLTRSRMALILTWLVTHLFSRSVVVRYDGPLSVRAAYTVGELSALARRAGLRGATVTRRFPFRMILAWSKRQAVPV